MLGVYPLFWSRHTSAFRHRLSLLKVRIRDKSQILCDFECKIMTLFLPDKPLKQKFRK